MEEPNLLLIKEISENDMEFQNSILSIIKKEFPEEVELYKSNYSIKNYDEASSNVHKLKHKISLLGLIKGSELASEFEKDLKSGNTKLHDNFVEILNKIHVYLNN